MISIKKFKAAFKKKKEIAPPEDEIPAWLPPSDPARTATLLQNLRSTTAAAEGIGTTLLGALGPRRAVIVDAIDTDDYDTAEAALASLHTDVTAVVAAHRRWTDVADGFEADALRAGRLRGAGIDDAAAMACVESVRSHLRAEAFDAAVAEVGSTGAAVDEALSAHASMRLSDVQRAASGLELPEALTGEIGRLQADLQRDPWSALEASADLVKRIRVAEAASLGATAQRERAERELKACDDLLKALDGHPEKTHHMQERSRARQRFDAHAKSLADDEADGLAVALAELRVVLQGIQRDADKTAKERPSASDALEAATLVVKQQQVRVDALPADLAAGFSPFGATALAEATSAYLGREWVPAQRAAERAKAEAEHSHKLLKETCRGDYTRLSTGVEALDGHAHSKSISTTIEALQLGLEAVKAELDRDLPEAALPLLAPLHRDLRLAEATLIGVAASRARITLQLPPLKQQLATLKKHAEAGQIDFELTRAATFLKKLEEALDPRDGIGLLEDLKAWIERGERAADAAATKRLVATTEVGQATTLIGSLDTLLKTKTPAEQQEAQPAQILALATHRDAKAFLDTGELDRAITSAKAVSTILGAVDLDAVRDFLDRKNEAELRIAWLRRPEHRVACDAQLARVMDQHATILTHLATWNKRAAKLDMDELFALISIARASVEAYAGYPEAREKVRVRLGWLHEHRHADAVAKERSQLAVALHGANALGTSKNGGWKKATKQAETLLEHAKRLLALVDQMEQTDNRVAALKETLEARGLSDEDVATLTRYAHKLIATQGLDDTKALALAEKTRFYADAGIAESDALTSAQVEDHLVTTKGVDPELARAIGKNLRSTGTATLEDTEAVAEGLANYPKGMLDALTAAGITTAACRGSVVDCDPGQVGEHPRGWGPEDTWDKVPGAYLPSTKQVVIGTIDKGGDRKVPLESEGHDAADLIGHEAGHAFDAVSGSLKNEHASFKAARQLDIALGAPNGLDNSRVEDHYFLTQTEGGIQATDAGARSETFAESCARHFSNSPRAWTNLAAFWTTNPWGV